MFPFALKFALVVVKLAAVLSAFLFAAVSFGKEAKPDRGAPVVEWSFLTLDAERRKAYLDWARQDGELCLQQLQRSGVAVEWRVPGPDAQDSDDADLLVIVTFPNQMIRDALRTGHDPALSQLTALLHGAADGGTTSRPTP
jgi:hypothetical protein